MKRHSFFLRLFLGNLLLIALATVASGLLSYRSLNTVYVRQEQQQQEQLLHLVRNHFEKLWPTLAENQFPQAVKTLLPNPDIRLTVIARDGQVLGDSHPYTDLRTMENHLTRSRPEVLAAVEGKRGQDVRTSETLGVALRYLALPIRQNEQIVGVVRIAMPVRALVRQRDVIRNTLLLAAASSGFAAVGLGLLMSWTWYAPLRQISATAQKIAAGDLAARASTHGPEELARLGESLNEMHVSLAEQIETISAQRQNLQTVVGSLREGVVAVDAERRIVLINQAARRMLAPETPDPEGKHLQEVVRAADIVDAYEQAVRSRQPVNRAVEFSHVEPRIFLDLHARALETNDSRRIHGLIVLRDVTDLARSAAMKAEFVANASHELRTPLATLRAAVESLAVDGPHDPAAFQKYLDILQRHIARLEEMTHDLLDLHSVESGRTPLRREDILPVELIRWAQSQFADRAARKNLDLQIEAVGSRETPFSSDRKLLERILQNLLDNAVKFTPAGGQIRCEIRRDGAILELRVQDTGCGIRPEDRPRVFERFFQADASRAGDSRTRGTGLGLSIVKHAAERLGGTVDLQSEWGKGTTVLVRLSPLS